MRRVIFSLMIFLPQCNAAARKNTHKKQPSKMERQELFAYKFAQPVVGLRYVMGDVGGASEVISIEVKPEEITFLKCAGQAVLKS
jgi:hypothetical protein